MCVSVFAADNNTEEAQSTINRIVLKDTEVQLKAALIQTQLLQWKINLTTKKIHQL